MWRADSSAAGDSAAATRGERGAFGAVIVLYLLLSALLFNQIEEDAFIFFRLVGNIAEGYGGVFNRGGERIEAGSSPLWMLVLLLSWKSPLGIVITAKLLGLAAGCVALWLVWRISRLLIADPILRLGPALLTAASTPFLMWSQRGLETPLVAAVLLWFALCCVDSKRLGWWPLPGFLLLLARPEGFIFLPAAAAALGANRSRWRAAAPAMLALAGGAAFLLVARFLYFRDLAPAPFYVKFDTAVDSGFVQLRGYLAGNRLHLLALPAILVAWRPAFWTRQRTVLAVLVAVAFAWLALAKDYMPFVRPLVPAIPMVYVLLLSAVERLPPAAAAVRRSVPPAYVAAAFVATLFAPHSGGFFGRTGSNPVREHLVAFIANPTTFVRATAAKLRSPSTFGPRDALGGEVLTMSNFQSLVGEFLRRSYPPDSTVAYDQMGQTPFYAGPEMRFIDTLGLTDRTIGRAYFARRKRGDALLRLYDAAVSYALRKAYGEGGADITEAEALDYVFGLEPDVIMMVARLARHSELLPARLRRDPRLAERYEHRYTLANLVLVYERKTAPRKQTLDVPAGLDVKRH